jgi:putative hydrolase of the HAD superfamily
VNKLTDYDVVVFDLDDTLYSEKQYQESGYKAISNMIGSLYDVDFLSSIHRNKESKNVLKAAITELQLPEVLLEHCINIYRYHRPIISLYSGVKEVLDKLTKAQIPLYIITDGRSVTQRLKIESLGIKGYFQDVFISEEQGFSKPCEHSFKKIANLHRNKKIVYIGDNPKKDFIASSNLGWGSIGVQHLSTRVHPMHIVKEPDFWLSEISNLLE